MIKRVPYNDKLISIGNAPVYAGKPVYTDGRVAYGWTYSPQQTTPSGVSNFSGFWVGEQEVSGDYKLATRNLQLGKKIVSKYHGETQAYPCYSFVVINENFIYTPAGIYRYNGSIVALSGDGKSLCYDNFRLLFCSPGTPKKDTNDRVLYVGIVHIYSTTELLGTGYYHSKDDNTDTTYIYDRDMVQIATYSNGIVHTEDYEGQGIITIDDAYPYLDTIEAVVSLEILLSLERNIYRIQVVDGFSITLLEDSGKTVTKQGLKYIYDNSMVLLAQELGENNIVVYNNGQQVYRGIGGITVTNLEDTGQTDTDGDEIYNCNYRAIRVGTIAEIKQTPTIKYLYTTAGSDDVRRMFQLATTNDCYITANTPDRDSNGYVIYLGDYTYIITVPITSGSGKTVTKQGLIYVYDTNMYLVAQELGNDTIVVYDNVGQQIYRGVGKIDIYNLEDTGQTDTDGDEIYNCDYVAVKPLSSLSILSGSGEATISGNNITLYDSYTGNEIAHENDDSVVVYEDNSIVYNGPGSISTNMSVLEWSGDYDIRRDVDGSGIIVSIGGTVYQDQQGDWHIEGGTVQIYNTGSLFAEGPGSGSSGTVTIYYYPTSWTGNGWIDTSNLTPNGTDSQGNQRFTGSYTIRRDVTGQGLIREVGNDIYIYNSNNHNLIAREDGISVIMYDSQGQEEWRGYGHIDTYNRVPVRYSGIYDIDCSLDGATDNGIIITRDDDIYIYSTYTDDSKILVAREDGSELYIGQWTGYGYIEISNEDARRSVKQYYIESTGQTIIEQAYPQTIQLGTDIELYLNTMDLVIDGDTYTNDQLDLLQAQGIVYVGGVHCYRLGTKPYFISQDSKKIYTKELSNNIHRLQSQLYDGISNCWSLNWLRSRWR